MELMFNIGIACWIAASYGGVVARSWRGLLLLTNLGTPLVFVSMTIPLFNYRSETSHLLTLTASPIISLLALTAVIYLLRGKKATATSASFWLFGGLLVYVIILSFDVAIRLSNGTLTDEPGHFSALWFSTVCILIYLIHLIIYGILQEKVAEAMN